MTDKPNRSSQIRKQQIIQLIRDNPGLFGPEDIARKLGSTRASIAVVICNMRAEGTFISMCTVGKPVEPGHGYRLLEEPNNA